MVHACYFLKPDDLQACCVALRQQQRALLGVIASAPRGSPEHARALAQYGAIAGRLSVLSSPSETA